MGISGLFPYLSLLNLLVGNKGSRREREDAHLLCYTGEAATAGLSLHGHSSEAGGLPCSVFIVTVLTLENTAVGQW